MNNLQRAYKTNKSGWGVSGWDAYNESRDLKEQIENYRRRFGYYPASVHADTIYRTRSNRDYCKERDRIPVEGKFGNVKRKGSLGRIMAKLSYTAESVIHVGRIVLNLDKYLRDVLCCLIHRYLNYQLELTLSP